MTAQLPSTEYTLEDLREIAYRGSYDDMQRNLARALLAAHEQEPVGIVHGVAQTLDGSSFVALVECKTRPSDGTEFFAHPAPSGTNQVDELVMWVKRLVHSLKKDNPDSKLHLDAMDYLKRNSLIGLTDVLRVSHPAPSIPAVSFYRDGIEAAAKWVDAQREAYDNEHGTTDPETGTFEFGNDAQLEYSATLAEIADGIRALHPNADSAPSIPAAVPEEATPAIIDMMARKFEWGAAECIAAFRSWNACRAAMLPADLVARSDERIMEMPKPTERSLITTDKVDNGFCHIHRDTNLLKHPFMQLSCYPPRPAMYCPKCEPHVAEWDERDKELRSYGKGV